MYKIRNIYENCKSYNFIYEKIILLHLLNRGAIKHKQACTDTSLIKQFHTNTHR